MSLFAKLFSSASKKVAQFTNADSAEAYIGGMILAGAIDGDFDDKEFEQTCQMISANEMLKDFNTDEIVGRWENKVKASVRMAKRDFLNLCEKLQADKDAAENVFIGLVEVVYADGKVDPAEDALLDAASKALQVDASKLM